MTPEEIESGIDRYLTRQQTDPRRFAMDFRNARIFVLPIEAPEKMVPLAWAISALDDGWEVKTRSMNSGNARTRAHAAGLGRIEVGDQQYDDLFAQSQVRVTDLTQGHRPPLKSGFSKQDGKHNSFYLIDSLGSAFLPEETGPLSQNEGSSRQFTTNRYERKSSLRAACIKHYRSIRNDSLICEVCAFDFHAAFGDVGEGFIHIHHLDPLGNRQEERLVNAARDLVPLCPNCHAMAHRHLDKNDPPRSVCDLRKLLNLERPT